MATGPWQGSTLQVSLHPHKVSIEVNYSNRDKGKQEKGREGVFFYLKQKPGTENKKVVFSRAPIYRTYLVCGQGPALVATDELEAPRYARNRKLFKFQVSPRQARVLVVTGPVNFKFQSAIVRLSRQLARPGQILALGSWLGLPYFNSTNYPAVSNLQKTLTHTLTDIEEAQLTSSFPVDPAEVARKLEAFQPGEATLSSAKILPLTEGPGTLVPLRPFEERELNTEDLTLSLGPYHPAIYGPLRLILTLDGEQVVAAEADPGFSFRGLEKAAEGVRPSRVTAFGEALDALAPLAGAAAVTGALEKLLGPGALPPRGEYLRLVALELERIASHLFATARLLRTLGLPGKPARLLDLRARVIEALKAFSDSESAGTGDRGPFSGYILPGGVRNNPNPQSLVTLVELTRWLEDWVRQELDPLPLLKRLGRYSLESRLKGIGMLEKEVALAWGVTGPNLRASGESLDGRALACGGQMNKAYLELNFCPVVFQKGDCLARYQLRIVEIAASAALIRQAVENMPPGAFRTEVELDKAGFNFDASRIPAEASGMVESPRGLLSASLALSRTEEGLVVERLHFITPSLAHYRLLPELVKEAKFDDALAILNSLDIAPDEAER